MARHAPDRVKLLQENVSLERLVAEDGVHLDEDGGGHLHGRCPRHPDQLLNVNRTENTWSCPACEVLEGGPVEWVMVTKKASRSKAIDMLSSGVEGDDDIVWPRMTMPFSAPSWTTTTSGWASRMTP